MLLFSLVLALSIGNMGKLVSASYLKLKLLDVFRGINLAESITFVKLICINPNELS